MGMRHINLREDRAVKRILSTFIVCTCLSSAHLYSDEIVSPVVDGMTLQLGDYVQEVKVRVKSLGPGFCGTVFTLQTTETQFLAPPFVWSDWISLEPFSFGKNTMKLGLRVVCDTGVIAEVKYEK